MILQSKLLKKGYGLDPSGTVIDQDQDNIRDKNNPIRNPDKVDINKMNFGLDGTMQPVETAQMELAKEKLNPHVQD